MKAVQTFSVVTPLPPQLEPLDSMARNLGWIFDERVQALFRRVDGVTSDYVRDPARMLAEGDPDHLAELAADDAFTARAAEVAADLQRSAQVPRWFQRRGNDKLTSVAYFSPEFGVAAGLPQYSGGLGVLAGDHLKAADALGLPLVGVGLFYHHGYFTQEVDLRGNQNERFPRLDPASMALRAVPDVRVEVEIGGSNVTARIWQAQVGRIALYLLDTDVEENSEEDRLITDRLYGGGVDERIRQEILLGVGGVRALQALGISPQVFHINEGHAGFLALERIRRAMVDDGLTFAEARAAVRPGAVFTTHTPVPAGIDRFDRALMERHFASWCREVGVTFDELMDLGHEPGLPNGEVFNMAVMSLRLTGSTNGVSALHGEVSRKMFADVWPGIPVEDVPIGSVTNGVHAPSWTSREMSTLFERHVGSDWTEADADRWQSICDVSDRELWAVRRTHRERLVTYLRERLRRQGIRRGQSESQVAWVDDALDPDVLTIGFARRFATYKRANLVFRDLPRLEALLTDTERPVQLVFAGKAHPADEPGKALLREIATMAEDLDLRHRLVFIEDYDIGVARMLVEGVDVWLNNPLRPMEACGTSGMKSVFNGGLNCSVLDGWWDEVYDGDVGWAIPSAEWEPDPDRRNEIEAKGMLNLLEQQLVPLFYERDGDALPAAWLAKVRASLSRLCPRMEATRMLKDYVVHYYEPAAVRSEVMRANGDERARALVRWERHVLRAWPSVAVMATDHEVVPGEGQGDVHRMSAQIVLGDVDPADVAVQVLVGPIGPDDELRDPVVLPMRAAGPGDRPDWTRYEHDLAIPGSGVMGFTVRVVPHHPDVRTYADIGRVAWAG